MKVPFVNFMGVLLFRWGSSWEVCVKHICQCMIFCHIFACLPVFPFRIGCNHALGDKIEALFSKDDIHVHVCVKFG